jgi:hypothetical protein
MNEQETQFSPTLGFAACSIQGCLRQNLSANLLPCFKFPRYFLPASHKHPFHFNREHRAAKQKGPTTLVSPSHEFYVIKHKATPAYPARQT